jgi:SSS family solute:Na+ symporter
MATIDWLVLFFTLGLIVSYGIWRSRGIKDMKGYLLGNNRARWWAVGLSVMATQASAITFLSTPGQAYTDGMGFVQFYFGLPIAMIVICLFLIPLYYRLKVYTAYEFLESRLDLKTRSFAAFLFLIQRGLGAGITIYAPAIILSTILGWRLDLMNVLIGVLVIIYTVSGGTRAVTQTQKVQMFVIFTGMFIAFFLLIDFLPDEYSLGEAFSLAGASGKMDVLDFSFDLNNRYTIWTGIIGGFFLQMAYFGTDQSQVQRYLSSSSIGQSRLGLLFNGLVKIPMQFFILLVGVMVFIFYQFNQAPIFFNPVGMEVVEEANSDRFSQLNTDYDLLFNEKLAANDQYIQSLRGGDEVTIQIAESQLRDIQGREGELRTEVKDVITSIEPSVETNDKDYVFINFIINHLPKGIIGLLLAVIFSAAMSSTAAELNALASTTCVDIYKRNFRPKDSGTHMVRASKVFTLFWGIFAIAFATFGTLFENLIQFVNIIGSIFYGTILGIFVAAIAFRFLRGTAVFFGAVIAEIIVITTFLTTDLSFLWYNLIGCAGVIIFASIIQIFLRK